MNLFKLSLNYVNKFSQEFFPDMFFMETSRMKAEVYLVQNLKKNSPTIHKFQCTLGSVLVFLGI